MIATRSVAAVLRRKANAGGGGGDATADAHWMFNDGSGSTAADGSGNGKTLTLSGSPTWGTGPNSNGCLVLASNAYGTVSGDSAFANFTSSDFTLMAWVNASSLANDPILFFKGEFGGGGYYVQLLNSGVVRYNVNAEQLESPASAVSTSSWYHIAITKTGTTGKIYVNGSQVQSATISAPTSSSADFQVGRYAASSSFDLAASIDDARVYSSLKDASAISAIYSAGAQ